MWLRDFLSKDLPCCRTIIYGYNSKLLSYRIDTIIDYGWGLIEELKKIRNRGGKRCYKVLSGEREHKANGYNALAKTAAALLYCL
jgi:hypothetical protein